MGCHRWLRSRQKSYDQRILLLGATRQSVRKAFRKGSPRRPTVTEKNARGEGVQEKYVPGHTLCESAVSPRSSDTTVPACRSCLGAMRGEIVERDGVCCHFRWRCPNCGDVVEATITRAALDASALCPFCSGPVLLVGRGFIDRYGYDCLSRCQVCNAAVRERDFCTRTGV